MRRRFPTFFDRVRRGWPVGGTVFAGACAVITFFNDTSGINGLWFFLLSLPVALAAGFVAAYTRGRLTSIPPTIIELLNRDGSYTVRYSTESQLREACELTREPFGRDYVAGDTAELWRQRNSNAFVSLLNESGQLCGCFGIIALGTSCFDEFIRGRVAEEALESVDILSADETRRSNRLYLSGIVVRDPGTAIGNKRAMALIWAMLRVLETEFGFRRRRELYALAVTREGEHLLHNLGFTVISKSTSRRDNHDLYTLLLTREAWRRVLMEVGDWREACHLEL